MAAYMLWEPATRAHSLRSAVISSVVYVSGLRFLEAVVLAIVRGSLRVILLCGLTRERRRAVRCRSVEVAPFDAGDLGAGAAVAWVRQKKLMNWAGVNCGNP